MPIPMSQSQFLPLPALALAPALTLALALAGTPTLARATPDASCPDAATQLEELLAATARQLDQPGEVQARFEVDAQGRVQAVAVVAVSGHRAYATRARGALNSLDCRPGRPQGYRLTIRFAPDSAGGRAQPAMAAASR